MIGWKTCDERSEAVCALHYCYLQLWNEKCVLYSCHVLCDIFTTNYAVCNFTTFQYKSFRYICTSASKLESPTIRKALWAQMLPAATYRKDEIQSMYSVRISGFESSYALQDSTVFPESLVLLDACGTTKRRYEKPDWFFVWSRTNSAGLKRLIRSTLQFWDHWKRCRLQNDV